MCYLLRAYRLPTDCAPCSNLYVWYCLMKYNEEMIFPVLDTLHFCVAVSTWGNTGSVRILPVISRIHAKRRLLCSGISQPAVCYMSPRMHNRLAVSIVSVRLPRRRLLQNYRSLLLLLLSSSSSSSSSSSNRIYNLKYLIHFLWHVEDPLLGNDLETHN
jgi:hypothetical protein